MRRIRIMRICLMAVLVTYAVTAAIASAEGPVFQRVITTPVKEGEKIPFTATTAKTTLETVGKEKIPCLRQR